MPPAQNNTRDRETDPSSNRDAILTDQWYFFRRTLWLLLAVLIPAGCGSKTATIIERDGQGDQDDPRARLESAAAVGDWEAADEYAKAALIAHPNDPDLVTLVAKVNGYNGRETEAAQLLVDSAEMANYLPAGRVDFAVQALLQVGRVYDAIDLLESSLAKHPGESQQRRMLVGFLAEVQRDEKIGPHMLRLIQDRAFDLPLLMATTEPSERSLSDETASQLLKLNPTDRRVRLADAFLALEEHDAAGAIGILEEILESHPNFTPAHSMYGQALVQRGRWDDLEEWITSIPPGSQDYCRYWLTLGDVAMREGRLAEAVSAYWEATRCDISEATAWDRLLAATQQLRANDPSYQESITDEQVVVIVEHTENLLSFRARFNEFVGGSEGSQVAAERVARALLAIGRVWEAEAWSAIAMTLPEDKSEQLSTLRQEIVARLRGDVSWVAKQLPAKRLDFSFLPDPAQELNLSPDEGISVVPDRTDHGHLRLSDRTEAWGLLGVGFGNHPENDRLMGLDRSTGAGGGAIDFDLDGYVDLVAVNADGTILKEDSSPKELMRNLGERFASVSSSAGIVDRGFGQGVAVGDFNEDGFPDLLFANLGSSKLLRNNGDGTFSEASDAFPDGFPSRWSTSAAFADWNGDAVTDLFVASYCATGAGLSEGCADDQGQPSACHPLKYPAGDDQLFSGTLGGGLVSGTKDWIGDVTPGRGLGLITGMLDGKRFGCFVANDMTRNALYWSQAGRTPLMVDGAAASGVAVDGVARAQASMGVAASDFDLDGDLDFYVTGFAWEYNVYYEQVSSGVWTDSTEKLGLVEPTLAMVGFGTEAIDLDNDGIDEIVVTNGHIGPTTGPNATPYAMPFQTFRRGANGEFELIDDDPWGEYFGQPHVGRALWTLDVNRDGANDLVITHRHEPIRLLLNESSSKKHRIAFRLIGTTSSRDAIGAILRFKCGDKRRSMWLLSGDGYLCSNEKMLLAGLGEFDRITELTVTWPDGSVDDIGSVEGDRAYVIVQGDPHAFELHQYERE